MKTGFVLSGGGAKGAYQVGALEVLRECEICPDVIVGTSVGAINGITLAELGTPALRDFWEDLKSAKDIQRLLWWKLFTGGGVYDFKPLREKLERFLPASPVGAPAYAAYVELSDGSIHYKSQYDLSRADYIDALLASSSLGFFHVPVKNRVDGGHREALAIEFAVSKLKCERVIVIGTEPYPPVSSKQEKFGIVANGLRVVELMFNEIYQNDVRPWLGSSRAQFILPSAPLAIGGMEYTPDLIRKTIAQGRADAEKVLRAATSG